MIESMYKGQGGRWQNYASLLLLCTPTLRNIRCLILSYQHVVLDMEVSMFQCMILILIYAFGNSFPVKVTVGWIAEVYDFHDDDQKCGVVTGQEYHDPHYDGQCIYDYPHQPLLRVAEHVQHAGDYGNNSRKGIHQSKVSAHPFQNLSITEYSHNCYEYRVDKEFFAHCAEFYFSAIGSIFLP